MSEHARIENLTVAAIVDIDPALHASWVAAGNPKAIAFRPVVTDAKPPFNQATHALDERFTVLADSVIRSWTVRPLTADELRKVWSTLEFLGRFSDAEMQAIETAREHDEIVRSFYRAAMAANEIVSDDPRTAAGMDYLVAIGILTMARRNAILG
jgi:hypothetical protein